MMGCRTLNSAGFLSLSDDLTPEEDEHEQFGQVAMVWCLFMAD